MPDLAAAREIAVNGIRSMLADDVKHGVVDLRGRIDICSETGDVLAVVGFSEAVDILVEPPECRQSGGPAEG